MQADAHPSARDQPAPEAVAWGLGRLLTPQSVEGFFANGWRSHDVWIAGDPGKFADLFSWETLAALLETHRPDPLRLRLMRGGSAIPFEKWTVPIRSRSGEAYPRIDSRRFIEHLDAGATATLRAIDDMHPPVRAVVESMEALFRCRVQVNLYAGWGEAPGFDLHCDDHDVYAVQIDGAKAWSVHGPSDADPYPLSAGNRFNACPPPAARVERELRAGSVLYLPRGWWHTASAAGRPSLHLTFGVFHQRGVDFMAWAANQIAASPEFRMDLPHGAPAGQLAKHLSGMAAITAQAFSAAAVERYLDAAGAPTVPRPRFPDLARRAAERESAAAMGAISK